MKAILAGMEWNLSVVLSYIYFSDDKGCSVVLYLVVSHLSFFEKYLGSFVQIFIYGLGY